MANRLGEFQPEAVITVAHGFDWLAAGRRVSLAFRPTKWIPGTVVQCVAATMAFSSKESKHYQCEHVLLQSYGFGGDEPRFDSAADALAKGRTRRLFRKSRSRLDRHSSPSICSTSRSWDRCTASFFDAHREFSNLSDAIVTLLVSTVCLGVATLSWHFFERPIVQYGRRIRYQG
jgi:hypothetical protein